MKIRFRASKHLRIYNGSIGMMADGDIRDISDKEAARLLSTFPDHFEAACEDDEGKINTAILEHPLNTAEAAAPSNTAEKGSRRKRR